MGSKHTETRRLHAAGDMEIGATEAVADHVSRQPKPVGVTRRKLRFEDARPQWIREMAAESIGVFIFVYPGIASQASFFLNGTEPAFGSIFQIGIAFGFGIASAIMICGPTSGGHLNPAITVCFAIWHGFPWKKVPRYIFAQIFGAFMAALILVGQYHPQLSKLAITTREKGASLNSSGGPGSVLCSFPAATQTNYGYLFLIEFFADFFLGLMAWTALDSANPFVTPASAPFIIGFAWANMIWGFGFASISLNGARDLGTRLVAAIFFGRDAFTPYALIAIFASVPATVVATTLYEIVLRDSRACIDMGNYVCVDDETEVDEDRTVG